MGGRAHCLLLHVSGRVRRLLLHRVDPEIGLQLKVQLQLVEKIVEGEVAGPAPQAAPGS